jgi:hypothetical protein
MTTTGAKSLHVIVALGEMFESGRGGARPRSAHYVYWALKECIQSRSREHLGDACL